MELLLALGLGLLHGVEPDHLAVVSLLTVRGGGLRESAQVGLRFALGHVVVLLVAAGLAVGLQITLTPEAQTVAEMVSGVVLALLGLWFLLAPPSGVEIHAHTHRHDGHPPHTHLHVHRDGEHHDHRHLSWALGGLFAVGGARTALLVAIPALSAGSPMLAMVAVALFGVGIIVSMSVAGYLMARFSRLLRGRQMGWISRGMGAVAMIIGVVWAIRGYVG